MTRLHTTTSLRHFLSALFVPLLFVSLLLVNTTTAFFFSAIRSPPSLSLTSRVSRSTAYTTSRSSRSSFLLLASTDDTTATTDNNNNNKMTSYKLKSSLSTASLSAFAVSESAEDIANMWEEYFQQNSYIRYQIIAAPTMEGLAKSLVELYPDRFLYHPTQWNKFSDGTDNIEIGGFHPKNRISGENVLLLASFHNNDVTLSQFSVMITLLQSFILSLTVVLPFYPVGTMERVIQEGQVATANTYAQMFSNLPSCGKPTRLIIYDLHTLQNRFYLHNNAIASLQTTIPILIQRIRESNTIDCIAFPDDGAAKRFSSMFLGLGYEIVTCGKTRYGDRRVVIIQDGVCMGKNVLIIDDLVQTGGTLYECGVALKQAGALSVHAFVAHAVFPNDSWKRFLSTGDRHCFQKFYCTNSIPSVTERMPKDDVFEILPLNAKIVEDLDRYS